MVPGAVVRGILLACINFTAVVAQSMPGGAGGGPTGVSVAVPAPSAPARDLFAKHKDRLVQVRVLLNTANEQASLGTGFVVRDDPSQGVWLLTNYHVVSQLAVDPEKFRIELRQTSERTMGARLVAIDVVHDLALLRAEPPAGVAAWPLFSLREGMPAQGERLYALGNPLELGFLISEGIYNGLVESRVYDHMLFSGAINAGMSGGPAIDESGRVVGVNVAVDRRGQLISYLVPVRYARDLLARATTDGTAVNRKEWRTEIGRQLLVHQDYVAGKLFNGVPAGAGREAVKAGFGTQSLAGRSVATLDGNLTKCWAGGRDGEKLRYQRDRLTCSLRSEIFVRREMYTGSLEIDHSLLRNDTLAAPQFFALQPAGYFSRWLSNLSTREVTPEECRDDYVSGGRHVYRVAVCLRAYRKFEGIYDFTVAATQVDDARERMTSKLSLTGMSFANGQRLTRMFLERLQ